MTRSGVVKHLAIAVAAVVFGFVVGFIGAFVTSPIWGLFEDATGIESVGHSGPADWVFDLMFAICIPGTFVLLEWIFRAGQGSFEKRDYPRAGGK